MIPKKKIPPSLSSSSANYIDVFVVSSTRQIEYCISSSMFHEGENAAGVFLCLSFYNSFNHILFKNLSMIPELFAHQVTPVLCVSHRL